MHDLDKKIRKKIYIYFITYLIKKIRYENEYFSDLHAVFPQF